MSGNQKTTSEVTLRDVHCALIRHRKKAIAFFLLVMTMTVVVTLLTPKAYISESKLFVRLGRENAMLDPTATFGNTPVVAVPTSRESEINSVAEMLSSRAIMEQVVSDLGPEAILDDSKESASEVASGKSGFAHWLSDVGKQGREGIGWIVDSVRSSVSSSTLSPKDKALERLKKKLSVEPVRKSNVVCVAFEAPAPELAQQVVSSVVDAYLEQHVHMNRTRGTHEFFAEHAKRLGDELAELEGELGELKTTTGLASVDEQRTQIVARIGRLEDELLTAQASQKESEARVRALREKLAILPKEQVLETSTGIGNQGTDLIRDKFFALQVEEKEASAVYTASHPKLQTIREQLAEAKQILDQQEPTRTQVKMVPDATYEQARAALIATEPDLLAIKAHAESLQAQLADVRSSLEMLNTNDIRIAQLKRKIDLCETDYRKYAVNLEQARIDHAMETERMSNLSVVQPASYEPRAIRPRKTVNLIIGMIIALGGALALPLLAEYVRRSYQPEDTSGADSPITDSLKPAPIRSVVLRTTGEERTREAVRQR